MMQAMLHILHLQTFLTLLLFLTVILKWSRPRYTKDKDRVYTCRLPVISRQLASS